MLLLDHFKTAILVPFHVVSAPQILFRCDLRPIFDTKCTIGEIGNAGGFEPCDITVELAAQGDDAVFDSSAATRNSLAIRTPEHRPTSVLG